MRYLALSFLYLVGSGLFAQQGVDSVLVCEARFTTSVCNNLHAGSGFLVSFEGTVYACTAKHVLLFAKTDTMKWVSFGKDLLSWQFVSGQKEAVKVKAGKLVNADPNEKLEGMPTQDWLVFKAPKELPKNVAVYVLRETPLKNGEVLGFSGYPYGTKGKQPIRVWGRFWGIRKGAT